MSGLFNLIKNLFSGIFSFVGGILSKKAKELGAADQTKPRKRSAGYFLEYEDAAGVGSSQPKPATQAAKPEVAKPEVAKPATAVKADPQPVATAESTATAMSKSEPQHAAVANALNLPQPTVTTFAPNYLTPTNTNGRRRPGANMASYLDMARQAKTPT